MRRGPRGALAARTDEQLELQAGFAHDLRTPLTRIGLRLERVRDAALRKAVERDLAEANSLIDASLACARTLHGGAPPARRVDPDELLRSLVDDYRDAGQAVDLQGRADTPLSTCPQSLRRVLANLIDNALRHGGDARVCVRVEPRQLVFAVVDTGPGIAPGELERVFAPFHRAGRGRGQPAGSGLGLAIARRLARSLQGEVVLENRRGGGLEARLTLPRASQEREPRDGT